MADARHDAQAWSKQGLQGFEAETLPRFNGPFPLGQPHVMLATSLQLVEENRQVDPTPQTSLHLVAVQDALGIPHMRLPEKVVEKASDERKEIALPSKWISEREDPLRALATSSVRRFEPKFNDARTGKDVAMRPAGRALMELEARFKLDVVEGRAHGIRVNPFDWQSIVVPVVIQPMLDSDRESQAVH